MNEQESQLVESLDRAFKKIRKMNGRALTEADFGRSVDLKNWNTVQGLLWSNVCVRAGWNRNDGQLFQAFGKFFYDWWEKHHSLPNVNDVLTDPRFHGHHSGKTVLLVDMDGTINEFDEHFVNWIRNMGYGFDWSKFTTWDIGKAITGLPDAKSQKKLFAHVLNDLKFWHAIPVMPEVQDVLANLPSNFHLKICTNPWGTEQAYKDVKLEWLAKFFPFIPRHDVVFSGTEKWLIPGDVIFDDKPEVLEKCTGLKVTVKSIRPYNHDVRANFSFSRWATVPNILQQIGKKEA